MAKAAKQAVVPAAKSKNLPAANNLAAFEGMGTGFENVTARDILIPRLTIIQSNSPQVTANKPEFDKNARVGNIYDIGMKVPYSEGIIFLPVFFQEQYLEWAPRESGKGLQGIHDTDAIMQKTEKNEQTGRNMLPNGNYIMETYQLYGLNVSQDFQKVFIPFSSTQRKKCKQLLTWAMAEKVARNDGSMFTPPLFYRTYALTTVPESNNKGSWNGWKVERGATVDTFDGWEQLLHDIKGFRSSLAKGDVRGDIASMQDEVNTVEHDDNGAM